MYVERILEEKKRLNLSVRTISDMSTHHLSEDTVSRVLARKTDNPGIVTIEDIAGKEMKRLRLLKMMHNSLEIMAIFLRI